jgi:hypothetical protein
MDLSHAGQAISEERLLIEAERRALARITERIDGIEGIRQQVDAVVQVVQDEIEHLYSELAEIRRMRERRGMK